MSTGPLTCCLESRTSTRPTIVHDLDAPRIEMRGHLEITRERYVSFFMPKTRNNAAPGRVATIWDERAWAKRDGRWRWLSHRPVWVPHDSPAGVDPTQVSAAQ